MSREGKKISERARELRRNATEAERHLWKGLRAPGFADAKFRRQAPVGRYIVDFVSFKHKLIIEVDGGHHQDAIQATRDAERTRWLRAQGFRVLRFWNNDVLTDTQAVHDVIFINLIEDAP